MPRIELDDNADNADSVARGSRFKGLVRGCSRPGRYSGGHPGDLEPSDPARERDMEAAHLARIAAHAARVARECPKAQRLHRARTGEQARLAAARVLVRVGELVLANLAKRLRMHPQTLAAYLAKSDWFSWREEWQVRRGCMARLWSLTQAGREAVGKSVRQRA